MFSKSQKSKRIVYLSIILFILSLNFFMMNLDVKHNEPNNDKSDNDYIDQQEMDLQTQDIVEDEFTEEWLKNGNFTGGTDPWYNTTEGDETDVIASYSDGAANFEVMGEKRTFTSVANPPSNSNWTARQNPDFPAFPEWPAGGSDQYGIDEYGCWVMHQWREGPRQDPSVHWIQNITMPVNMSDYIITSASVDASVNGTVTAFPGGWNQGGIDVPGDTMDQYVTYDFARFYVLVSDLSGNKKYEIAYNQTVDLGKDSAGSTDSMPNTFMIQVPEEILIFYLTSVLQTDYRHFNITLGIRIHCEDSFSSDCDYWNELRITSFNLTFKYEKKMDQLSSLSWNQIGNKISGQNVDIKEGRLNFKYKINETWPSSLSPNSEIRIIINGTQHPEIIKLSSATIPFIYAKSGGFDVTNLIKKDVNISLSIQVFLADEFGLDRVIRISIDNVSLNITYTVSTTESTTELNIYLNGIDKSLDKSIEIPWRETVNITVTYRNSTSGNPILGATVDVNGTGISELLNPISSNYSVVINSTDLAFGNNYLTLHAEKKYYVSITETIKITVIDRPTFLDNIFLNYTEQTSIYMQYNEILNISVSYNDTLSNDFISGATVSLNGTDISEPMSENDQKQYSVEINTTDLTLGLNFLTVSAQKENYSLVTEAIIIGVNLKDAYLDVSFNGTSTTQFDYYNISIGETINITAWYREVGTNAFVDSATVEVIGSGILQQMPPHPVYEQYNTPINATDFGDVGVKFLTITAQKENYTSRSEAVTVILKERATNLRIWLNGTERTSESNPSIELNVNETLNITVTYRDYTFQHLSEANGAHVRILGSGIDDNFTENVLLEQYNYTLNTNDLAQGINFVNILAERNLYESQYKLLTIIVTERNSSIEIYINGTDYTYASSITEQLIIGERLNVTIKYKDWLTMVHIPQASVDIQGEGVDEELDEYEAYGHYTIILNSTGLNRGVNFLTITAYKPNYQPRQKHIRIEVSDKPTDLDLFLDGVNKTDDPFLELVWLDSLNISVIYKNNETKEFIETATIELRKGSTLLGEFDPHPSYDLYNFTINSYILGVGVNSLTIIASANNFETYSINLVITVNDKESNLESYLNRTQTTSIIIQYGKLLNVTAIYEDQETGAFIAGATVTLKEGDTIIDYLTQHSTYNHYNLTINTSFFGVGVKSLTISAKQDNYTLSVGAITITVIDRDTELDSYLDMTQTNFIVIQYGEELNISAVYKDQETGAFIPGATVTLKEGDTIIDYLPQHSTYNHYNLTINTSFFGVGVKSLTISAKQDNYSLIQKTITIEIILRDSDMVIYFNNTPSTSFSYYNTSIGEIINITVWYRDFKSGAFLDYANLELIENSNSYPILEHPDYDQYNITVNVTIFETGVKSLTIKAQRENYTIITEVITLIVSARQSEILLYINGTAVADGAQYFEPVENRQSLNITVDFRDFITKDYLPGADITLLGLGTLSPHPDYDQYNITIDISDVKDEGIAILTILAELNNYQSQTIDFRLEITRLQTSLDIFIDTENKTLVQSKTLPIGATFNLTIMFRDIDNAHIANANITLGIDFVDTVNKHPIYSQYTITIDTGSLNLGANIISIEAKKLNYIVQTETITIFLRKIRTDIDTEDGENTITIRPGEDVKITIELKDLDFGGGIEDAEVTYDWKLGDGDLDEDGDGLYKFTLEDVPEGTYTITISVYKKGSRYEFDDFEITLIVKRPAEENLLFQVLLIVAIIVGVALASYLIAYQRILKYPKPVRKVRKYRRTLKKKKAPSVDITGREKAIKVLFASELDKSGSLLEGKTSEEIASTDKMVKKSLKLSSDKIIEKSEKKSIVKKVDKSPNDVKK